MIPLAHTAPHTNTPSPREGAGGGLASRSSFHTSNHLLKPVSLAASRRAFTLIELIVATIMIAVLVAATYLAVSSSVRSRDRSEARAEASSRARLAASLIAGELRNTLRAQELSEARVSIIRTGQPGRGQDAILLFSHLSSPVRPFSAQPEGDECESQIRLEPSLSKPGLFTLWHRRQPVPDDYPDAGGVAVPIADGLKSLRFEAYDGSSWTDTWDSDNDGFPHAVRLTVEATDDSGKLILAARQIVAFDRVPIPLPSDDSTGTTTGTTTSTTSTQSRTN